MSDNQTNERQWTRAAIVSAAVAGLVIAATGPGCSYVFVPKYAPTKTSPSESPRCKVSEFAPALDTFYGSGFVGMGAVAAFISGIMALGEYDGAGKTFVLGAGFAAVGGGFLLSRAHGYAHVGKCRRSYERYLGLDPDAAEAKAVAP